MNSRDFLVKSASIASICVAMLLIVLKTVAFYSTNSISMLSTLIDSILDAFTSLINWFAIKQALKPADKEHRFGHGKFEALAGLGQSLFIIISGLFLLKEVYHRIFNTIDVPSPNSLSIGIIIFTILITILLVKYQQYVIKKTESVAIRADALHYETDLLINSFVLISLFVSQYFYWFDAITALIIIIFILKSSMSIITDSVNILMDKELPDDIRNKIKDTVLSHPEVKNLHDLRTRSAGFQQFIQLHVELDPKILLEHAHVISHQVEEMIIKEFPHADILIHQDPEGEVYHAHHKKK